MFGQRPPACFLVKLRGGSTLLDAFFNLRDAAINRWICTGDRSARVINLGGFSDIFESSMRRGQDGGKRRKGEKRWVGKNGQKNVKSLKSAD